MCCKCFLAAGKRNNYKTAQRKWRCGMAHMAPKSSDKSASYATFTFSNEAQTETADADAR